MARTTGRTGGSGKKKLTGSGKKKLTKPRKAVRQKLGVSTKQKKTSDGPDTTYPFTIRINRNGGMDFRPNPHYKKGKK